MHAGSKPNKTSNEQKPIVEDEQMNRSVSTWVRTRASRVHRGFTLVELLVVIAIIGLLVGITVPAVIAVRGVFEKGALKFEVNALNDAVENYRSKNGDYPPDGSSWPVMESHLRKAYPEILSTELALLKGMQLDPAESLVFFLGGFSTDKQRPFTGKGGPFIKAGATVNYNVSRDNSFYDFPAERMMFNDESVFAGVTDDALPVFMSRGNPPLFGSPYVYFDSRTYLFNKGTAAAPIYNAYQPSNIVTTNGPGAPRGNMGAVRPHLDSVAATGSFTFHNNKTFQVISPGIDGKFGGRLVALGAQWFNLAGKSFTFNGTIMGPDAASAGPFLLSENVGVVDRPSHDNACNFTEFKTLGDAAQ